jgi:cyclophilin family peptidyl-prolyl cis-trans isomerase
MKSSRVVRRLRRAACEVESLESRWLLSATVTSQIPAESLVANQTSTPINLGTYFNDPTVPSGDTAVLLETNDGNIPLVLTNSLTPNTVANFLAYINNGEYDNTIFHRSVPGFVIQGGGYTNTGTMIASLGSITSEAGQPNVTGSIAMALSDGPDSATSEWFINLADNTDLNGTSDGGPFTVFGNVVYNGLTVSNDIAALPIVDDTGQGAGAWNTVPVLSGSNGSTVSTEPADNLVTLTPVIIPGGLTYSAVSSNTSLVSVTVNSGGSLSLVSHGAGGTATITVTATDMGGGTAQSQFNVDVLTNKVAFAAPVTGSATAGSTLSPITVDVENSSGTIITTDNSTVTLSYSKTGSSTIFGSTSLVAVNGVATFSNLTLNSAGSYTFTASDGALASATSGTFVITPAAASKLVFAATPANTQIFSTISPEVAVDVEDQFGNVVNVSDNVTIAVASGPTQTLSGTLTVAAANGVATFSNLSLNTIGTFTLSATDETENNVTAATSGQFAITPLVASKLAFAAQPTGATAGVDLSPNFVIDVEDSTGQLVLTDNSTVSLSYRQTGTGGVTGSFDASAANGVATFNSLALDTAGGYVFTATDGTLALATSGTVTITPAAPSKLGFATTPANTPAGSIISPAVVVDVEDQFGNIVNSSDNVTVAVGAGPQALSGTLTVAAVNGVATFNSLSLNVTGGFTLTATDDTENLTGGTSGQFTIGTSTTSKLAIVSQPTSGTAGVNLSPNFVVNVEDQFGSTILDDSSLVTLGYHQTGTGGLSGTLEATAIDGVATFGNLEFNRSGNYVFTATDGTLTAATSSTVTVNSAAESKLVFATSSSPTTAGAALNPVVDVEDQFGNIVSSSDQITLSAFNSNSVVVGTATAVAVNGVANFTGFALDTAANYSLTANDSTNTGVTAGTSGFFAIGAAAPAKLVFAANSFSLTAGVIASPAIVVDVQDQFGNFVSTDNSPISLAVASGGKSSVLRGTLKVTADNGAATFGNVLINTTGTYTLAATQGSLHGTSGSVVVNPLPSKLVFVNQPNSTLVGATINTLTVYAETSKGQVVTTDDANVTIAIQSGAKGATLGAGTFALTVAAVNGTATFAGLNINEEGSFTLKASENTSKIAAAISHSFALTPKIVWSEEPAAANAGATIVSTSTNSPSLVVELVDANGNPVANANGAVKVALVGSGKLLGTTTVTAKNGVAAFSKLSLDTAGTFTLQASSGSLTPTQSSQFVVDPLSPVKLAFAALPTITADSPATIVVDVEDQFGNIVTSDGTTAVTLTLSSGTAAFGPVNDVNGVATFTNVEIAAGTYKLNAIAANRTPVVSKPITVKP